MILCMIGTTEIIIIALVVLLIFGGKKVPELMKGVGKGLKSFKEGMTEPTEAEMKRRVEEEIQRRANEKQKELDEIQQNSELESESVMTDNAE